jgi:hypothetical protein
MMKSFLFAALFMAALLAGCDAPTSEPVAVQPAPTETPLSPTSTPSPTRTATVTLTPTTTHTFTPTITFTPTLSPTLDGIQSLIASGDFVPYEGREISIVNVDGVDYIADQHGIKYFKQIDGKWVETDDCERLCHFFGSEYYDKSRPEQLFYAEKGPFPFLPDGSPQIIKAIEIGIRIEGEPYTEEIELFGEKGQALFVNAFFPNGKGGIGGKVKILVDVVPEGSNTYLGIGAQKKSNPSETDHPGSPYGYWAEGRAAVDIDKKIEWFQQPGNAARLIFPIDFQGPDVEPETYDDGTTNFQIRYVQQLLKDSNLRNELQKFSNDYKALMLGWNSKMEIPDDLIIPALRFNLITRINK